ncbi:hypothetical protein TEA_013051 [Camellia sinensis var. sinensis]|uniref:Uncharacterized protein n=1 Tax=Camellia sinensis var. sinensis TaxID=542762 RepID=A0A4V3WJK0_CAMSN|nr:hypothetical protein TEA_013051 [Camellia sinensis var. sinensis]
MLYKYAIPTPKDECSKPLQLGVSFAGGYVAGVLCAIVSHPADNLVSFLNNAKGATVGDVSTVVCGIRNLWPFESRDSNVWDGKFVICPPMDNHWICNPTAVKKIGVLGLFTRGLPLRIVMIGTLTGAQWGIYDAFKVFVGLPTTGGVAPVAATATELAKA